MNIYVYTYKYISKCNLFHLYNATCMYVFRPDWLLFSGGRSPFLLLAFLKLPIVLHVVVRLHGLRCPLWHAHWCWLCSSHIWTVMFVRFDGCSF